MINKNLRLYSEVNVVINGVMVITKASIVINKKLTVMHLYIAA